MGILRKIFNSPDPKEQKNKKFQELDELFDGDKEMKNNSKATWLTSRGNHGGDLGQYDEAIADFEEAIGLKNDFLPAHLGLAIAWEHKGEHSKAEKIIDSAPEQMKLHGKVIANKEDMINAMM